MVNRVPNRVPIPVDFPDGPAWVAQPVTFTPFASTCRVGHTTWHQFWANVLYTPILLFAYRTTLPDVPLLRVALFPLNVWLLEVVEGYALMFLFDGRNPAWTYTTDDAYFHGGPALAS